MSKDDVNDTQLELDYQNGIEQLMEQFQNQPNLEDVLKYQNNQEQPITYQFSDPKTNPFINDQNPKTTAINLCNKGEYQQGLLAFEASLQINTNQQNIWRIVGKLQQDNDNDRQAIAAFLEALKIDHNDINSLSVMGISCCNELDNEQACEYLKKWIILKYHIEEPVDLIASFEAVLLLNQDDVDLHVSLGVLYFMQQSIKSLECFQKALNLQPQNYQLLNKIGAVLISENKVNESINKYEEALKFQPNCVRILTNFGIAYSYQQLYEQALEKYITALTICPQATHIWTYQYQLVSILDRMDLSNCIKDRNLEKLKVEFQYTEKVNIEPQISCILILQKYCQMLNKMNYTYIECNHN